MDSTDREVYSCRFMQLNCMSMHVALHRRPYLSDTTITKIANPLAVRHSDIAQAVVATISPQRKEFKCISCRHLRKPSRLVRLDWISNMNNAMIVVSKLTMP